MNPKIAPGFTVQSPGRRCRLRRRGRVHGGGETSNESRWSRGFTACSSRPMRSDQRFDECSTMLTHRVYSTIYILQYRAPPTPVRAQSPGQLAGGFGHDVVGKRASGPHGPTRYRVAPLSVSARPRLRLKPIEPYVPRPGEPPMATTPAHRKPATERYRGPGRYPSSSRRTLSSRTWRSDGDVRELGVAGGSVSMGPASRPTGRFAQNVRLTAETRGTRGTVQANRHPGRDNYRSSPGGGSVVGWRFMPHASTIPVGWRETGAI